MHNEIGSLFVNEWSEKYLLLQDAWQLWMEHYVAQPKNMELKGMQTKNKPF